ncbi:MAG: phosphotransferase family protein [Methylobacteriaceae bacterium]|nr:phosphotransferase family protein [Methylobacteriaceae bacterium]
MARALDRQASFSGTKEIAPALAFDFAALADFLAPRLAGFAGPVTARQFKGGQSNPTYLIETPACRYVLRRKPPGKLLASAHAVDREFRIMTVLHREGFPVAEPLLFCPDPEVIGTPFYIMAHIEGRIFWNPAMPDSTPGERAGVYDVMNATLARLHRYEPATLGLADFGKAQGYVARQIKRWSENYRLSATADIPEMDRLMAWLPEHLPPEGRAALVHGDYRLDNLIINGASPTVSAVLDWELSTVGDPAADFAYHLMAWDMPRLASGAGTGSLLGADLAALGLPTRDAYASAYARRMGLADIPHLDFYFAYNFFRIAAILQGIVGRVRDGTATNENAPAMAEAVRPLAATALKFAERAR